jgi:DnaJ-class molecular chaperone
MTDYYNDLGVARDATPDEVRSAWKRWAATHHTGTGADHEEFVRVRLAYEVLSDPQARAEYDGTGAVEPGKLGGLLRNVVAAVPGWIRGSPAGDIVDGVTAEVRNAKSAYKDGRYLDLADQGLGLLQRGLQKLRG